MMKSLFVFLSAFVAVGISAPQLLQLNPLMAPLAPLGPLSGSGSLAPQNPVPLKEDHSAVQNGFCAPGMFDPPQTPLSAPPAAAPAPALALPGLSLNKPVSPFNLNMSPQQQQTLLSLLGGLSTGGSRPMTMGHGRRHVSHNDDHDHDHDHDHEDGDEEEHEHQHGHVDWTAVNGLISQWMNDAAAGKGH